MIDAWLFPKILAVSFQHRVWRLSNSAVAEMPMPDILIQPERRVG